MKKIIIITSLVFSGCMVVNKTFWLLRNDIADHNWIVGNNVKDLPSDATIELTKNSKFKGKFSGFGGCNQYKGEYTITSLYIKFKLKEIGKKSCKNIAKEKNFINNILSTNHLYIQNNRLVFSTENHKNLMKLFRH